MNSKVLLSSGSLSLIVISCASKEEVVEERKIQTETAPMVSGPGMVAYSALESLEGHCDGDK